MASGARAPPSTVPTHLIPLSVTGMLAFALLPLLQVTKPQEAFKHLGSQAVMFMLGVFFLTAAMIATGLSKRLTLLLLHRMDRNPRNLFSGVLTASVVLALCMPVSGNGPWPDGHGSAGRT